MARGKDKPFWFEEPEETKRFPDFQGSATTDVLIIGGGILGVLTAWQLYEEGIDFILLDKQHLVTESTGYTTALVSRSPDIVYHETIRKFGLKRVVEFLNELAESQRYLRQLTKNLRIPCDWVDCNSYFFSRKQTADMQKECDAILKTGHARPLNPAEFNQQPAGFPIAQGVVFEKEAHYHPRKFLWGLIGKSKGMQIYEDSEVTSLNIGKLRVKAILKNGTIEAKRVVLAGRTKLLPHLHKHFAAKKTYLLQLEFASEAPFADHLFWDNEIPYNYFRRINSNNILFGGRDRERSGEATMLKAFRELKTLAKEWWPEHKFRLARQWQGTIFETKDNIPYIGTDPKNPGKVFAAQGFAGVGMVMGAMASRVLASLILKKALPISKFLSFGR